MKKFDCFTFLNEFDLVKIRFNELRDHVDFFLIVESDQTFTGQPKPFYFDQLDLDKDLAEKIIRVSCSFPSEDMSSWEREHFQRNQITEVLKYADVEDLVIISDADEIPNPKTLSELDVNLLPLQLDVKQFFWGYHWQVPEHCNQGARPVVAKAGHLLTKTPQELRAEQLERIPNGGWHFSFWGEGDKIKYKIESFAHTEYDKDEYKSLEEIKFRIENGIDPFDRFPLKYQEVDETYPRSLQLLA